MFEILHDFPIQAAATNVFEAIATPRGLDSWWTLGCTGHPAHGSEYQLYFGVDYDWRAVVSRCHPNNEFELRLTRSMPDWMNTRVGFQLLEQSGVTQLRFHHVGWPEPSDHFRTSSYCWAMYLRLLRRFVEFGEVVPYDRRLDV